MRSLPTWLSLAAILLALAGTVYAAGVQGGRQEALAVRVASAEARVEAVDDRVDPLATSLADVAATLRAVDVRLGRIEDAVVRPQVRR